MLRAAALALSLAAAGAPAAHAGQFFDTFQSMCVKPAANAAVALKAAEAAGWMPIPDAMMTQITGAMGILNIEGRMKSEKGGLSFVLVGSQELPVADFKVAVRICAVASTLAGGGGDVKGELAAWAAVEPDRSMSKKDQIGYVFSDDPTGHKLIREPKDSAVKDLIKTGRVRFAFVEDGKDISMLAFAVPSI